MKRFATLTLSLAGLVGLSSLAEAQLVPPPNITSVPSRDAINPGRVQILGSSLGLITSARINGVEVPIIRNTGTKVVVGPLGPRPPGFGTAEVRGPFGNDSAPIQFTPTLEGHRRRNTVTVTVDADDVGTYIIRYNRSLLVTPVTDPGIHYQRFFQTSGPGSGVLAAGVFANSEPVTLNRPFPISIGLVGAPLYVQAECAFGPGETLRSYTNLVTVPGFPVIN